MATHRGQPSVVGVHRVNDALFEGFAGGQDVLDRRESAPAILKHKHPQAKQLLQLTYKITNTITSG